MSDHIGMAPNRIRFGASRVLAQRYRMLGLVWLDTGQWRIEDSPLAERAFRAAVSGLRPVHP
jgi:hypothetical protein